MWQIARMPAIREKLAVTAAKETPCSEKGYKMRDFPIESALLNILAKEFVYYTEKLRLTTGTVW